jgi:hypothetical protein
MERDGREMEEREVRGVRQTGFPALKLGTELEMEVSTMLAC